MREMIIAGRRIADDSPAWLTAEIGNNHCGSVETAAALIKMAADAGADACKFQTRSNRDLYTQELYDSPYNSPVSYGPTYGAHREALELPLSAYADLKAYAESLGLVFFSTPFDFPSADFLARLDVPLYKIASGDLKFIPLIRHVASFGKPVLVSTGGGTLEDVERVVESIPWKPGQLAILQCTAAYPVEPHEMNLRVIQTYREHFPDVVIGLSDHFNGIFTGPVAYALGARVLEKHVTGNHTWKGTDHAFSLEPDGLRRLCRDLKRTPLVLGDGVKRPYESEAGGVRKMSKSLVLKRALPAGHYLRADDLEMRSPGGGLPPYLLPDAVGCRLLQALPAQAMVTREVLGAD